MDAPQAAIRAYFGKLGLETELADIYNALHSHGPQSISELSRNSKVERTRIYRLIDRLMESNLIEVETHSNSKRGIIKAAPISNIRILINQREEELKNLQDELALIEQALARNSLSNPDTRVQFYHGPEGIRQMMRNELNSKTEILAYANRSLEETVGKTYMQHWTDDFGKRKLRCRLLMNQTLTGSRPGVTFTKMSEDVFQIKHICHMYDNVVAYYHWKDGEVFGVETYNAEITGSQRQLFELLWRSVQ